MWTLDELTALSGTPEPREQLSGATFDLEPKRPRKIPPLINSVMYPEKYPDDRSAATMNLVRLCAEKGLTQENALYVLGRFAPAVDKYGVDLLPREVINCWTEENPRVGSSGAHEVAASDKKTTGGKRYTLEPVSAIKSRKQYWLWNNRIPDNALAILGGREGIGKSTITISLISDVTRGRLRDGAYADTPRNVIVAVREDSWETTVKPRLLAAGADLDRVFRMNFADGEKLDLPGDLEILRSMITEVDAPLVVVDPLISALDDSVDTDKGRELRIALEPVNQLAESTRCAIVGIAHFNKRGEGDVGLLLSGSLVWSQVARATLGVVRDKDTKNGLLLLNGKVNSAPSMPVLTAHTEGRSVDTDDGETTEASYVVWDGESELTEYEVLSGGSGARKNDRDKAAEWLSELLDGGPLASKRVFEKGRGQGYSDHKLRKAHREIGAASWRTGFQGSVMWGHKEDHPHTAKVEPSRGGA